MGDEAAVRTPSDSATVFGLWWHGFPKRSRRIVVAVLVLGFTGLLIMLLVGGWPEEQSDLYARYNDALVSKDLALAYSLGCETDKTHVSLSDFTALYDQAVAPLGVLTRWDRLRGGPHWVGTKGSRDAMPRIEKLEGHYCVRLGESPLGQPF